MIVTLAEWNTATPESDDRLRGISLDPEALAVAGHLRMTGRVVVTESRHGISIETTSFVGSLDLGPIHLRIRPKVPGPTLLALLRYAYGLRHLQLLPAASAATSESGFEDLLLFQLVAEVSELISRGLSRSYESRDQWLVLPRGRIDFNRLSRAGGVTRAALPCRSHHRVVDNLPNQVLLAALRDGVQRAADDGLRTRLQHLVRELDEHVTRIRLDWHILARLRRQMTRLTRAYEPSIALIEVLAAGQGVVIEPEVALRLPGFLFDMNRFFEALLLRFLTDNLPEADVQGQERLHDLFEYVPDFNPRNRRSPSPRPDLIVRSSGQATQLLDAKYRDLWEQPLPREMLYQLSIYTHSHAAQGRATILYPTTSAAREARIAIRDPVGGRRRGLVILRPVPLHELTHLLTLFPGTEVLRQRQDLAHQLVYGVTPRPVYQLAPSEAILGSQRGYRAVTATPSSAP